MNRDEFTPKRVSTLHQKLAKLIKKQGAQTANPDDVTEFNEALKEAKSVYEERTELQSIHPVNSRISNSVLEKRANSLKGILVSLNITIALEEG